MGERAFSDFYDSVQQRRFPGFKKDLGNSYDLLTARLRFDSLLAKTPRLIDTQILDGTLFLDINPEELLKAISRRRNELAPIEIMSRSSDLKDALVLLVKHADKEKRTLRGFSFSSIEGDGVRNLVQKELASVNEKHVNTWSDIAPLLKSLGVPKDNVEKINEGWARWIEANEKSKIKVIKWAGDFKLDKALGEIKDISRRIKTERGRNLVNWVYDHRTDRCEIDFRMSGLRSTLKDVELYDLAVIESWYHYGYNRAVARQHQCSMIESVYDSWLRDPSVESTLSPQLQAELYELERSDIFLDLPYNFMTRLGSMSTDKFQDIYLDNCEDFEKWWSEEDKKALQRGMEPFLKECMKYKVKYPKATRFLILGGSALFGLGVGAVAGPALDILAKASAEVFVEYVVHQGPTRKDMRRIIDIAEKRTKNE